MQVEEYLRRNPTFIETLHAAARQLEGKSPSLAGALLRYASELKVYDPQNSVPVNPFI